jgi:CRP/FNR family cyclic AMP-dependent transcriptional regulator
MKAGELGRVYKDGVIIVRQGDVGECMYVIQSGRVEVRKETKGIERKMAMLGEGGIFGEMALLDKEVRSATVRALGEARILTVDKRTFIRWMSEDPTVAFRVVEMMSKRIRELSEELVKLKFGE